MQRDLVTGRNQTKYNYQFRSTLDEAHNSLPSRDGQIVSALSKVRPRILTAVAVKALVTISQWKLKIHFLKLKTHSISKIEPK
jgi:hypothetical protein